MSAYREVANATRLAWEYKVLTFKVDAVTFRLTNAEPVLNEWGAAGWGIAGISPIRAAHEDQVGVIVYTLKRMRE